MAISLYTATVPPFRQILGAIVGLLDKAEAYCDENAIAHEEIIEARLAPDMRPFAYQVKSTVMHSIGAIMAVRSGLMSPDMSEPPKSFAALRDAVVAADAQLAAIDPQEVDGFEGRETCFAVRDIRLDFTAEDFLLSFSLPNFYFHATTAYDLLRMKGMPIGKRDYMGRMPGRPR